MNPIPQTERDQSFAETALRLGQVLSVQSTYDRGWRAFGNGQPAQVTRDGIGLTVIHPACDGPCTVDFVFDGGWERRLCRVLSWAVMLGAILAGFVAARSQNMKRNAT